MGISADGRTATLTWTVTGVTAEADVLSADPYDANQEPLPAYDRDHPRINGIKVSNVDVVRDGYDVWKVTAKYSRPSKGGGTHGEDPDDPLRAPPELWWEEISHAVPVDRDLEGNPIENSAGDAFEGGAPVTRKSYVFNVVQNEIAFNIVKALLFADATNSDAFEGGKPGELLLLSMLPTQRYTRLSEYIPVHYRIEFRDKAIWGQRPFDFQRMDRGFQAWVNENDVVTRYAIRDAGGEPISSPALLNAKGAVLKDGYTYETESGILNEWQYAVNYGCRFQPDFTWIKDRTGLNGIVG